MNGETLCVSTFVRSRSVHVTFRKLSGNFRKAPVRFWNAHVRFWNVHVRLWNVHVRFRKPYRSSRKPYGSLRKPYRRKLTAYGNLSLQLTAYSLNLTCWGPCKGVPRGDPSRPVSPGREQTGVVSCVVFCWQRPWCAAVRYRSVIYCQVCSASFLHLRCIYFASILHLLCIYLASILYLFCIFSSGTPIAKDAT